MPCGIFSFHPWCELRVQLHSLRRGELQPFQRLRNKSCLLYLPLGDLLGQPWLLRLHSMPRGHVVALFKRHQQRNVHAVR